MLCFALHAATSLSMLFLLYLFATRAKGLQHRQAGDEPVAGLFSQLGELYSVHHMWGE